MSQQNVNDWTDKFGRRLEIGQRIAAVRGKHLHVGEILWFTPQGLTINSEDKEGLVKKVPILYSRAYYGSKWHDGSHAFLILDGLDTP